MRRYIDVAKKDMKAGGVREEDRENAVRLMQIFGSANNWRWQRRREKDAAIA